MKEYNKNKFRDYMLNGMYDEASILFYSLERDIATDILIGIAMDGSILSYGFICRLISDNNLPEHHILASIVNTTACFVEWAYKLAYYHAKYAASLSSDIVYQENLLFFNEIHDKLLSDADAKIIAKNIIIKEPKNDIAIKILMEN